jgi:AcrR family transcriptional regulator
MQQRMTRKDQQARTRARLLEEGARAFADRGFLAVTVEEITAAAGVTRGALYKHFDGKEGLILAVIAESGEAQLTSWADGQSTARTDEEHLAALADLVQVARPELVRAGTEFLVHATSRPHLHEQVRTLQSDVDVQAATLLQRTVEALGVEPTVPADDLSVLMTSLASGLALRQQLYPDLDVQGLFRAGLVALLNGASAPLASSKELSDDRS